MCREQNSIILISKSTTDVTKFAAAKSLVVQLDFGYSNSELNGNIVNLFNFKMSMPMIQ